VAVEAEVARLLDAVGLPAAYADRTPGELSGGQRQRVALARALAARPRLLVCDEVTAALDTVTQTAILDLLADLSANPGLGILIITHSVRVGRHLADDVLLLADGEIAGHGPVEDILTSGHETTVLSECLRERTAGRL
jgi:peptide/nickel transport system ATP-binding protein